MGPLAQIAHDAGYQVSGSDKQDSSYIEYLKKHGIKDIDIDQTEANISEVHKNNPIDWFVYSSAVKLENSDAAEFRFVESNSIKSSKRDELLNFILKDKGLDMVAVAGTHGKTTTTALSVWVAKQLGLPISYLLPAKTNFAEMGKYDPNSKLFIYEADEFDRNFLAFSPKFSLITGVSYDHHEIFPTRKSYKQAFRDFINQSDKTYIWDTDYNYLSPMSPDSLDVLNSNNESINNIKLLGKYNRLDAMLVVQTFHKITKEPIAKLTKIVSEFPGLSRRMEKIADNLYSDYAHTPEKITGAMSVAREMAAESGQRLIIIYEPLTNRRQHYMIDSYKDVFNGADRIYWVPSYLAREDPGLRIIEPDELINHLDDDAKSKAEPANLDKNLRSNIIRHLNGNDLVVAMTGGGGGSLDYYLRDNF